MSDFVSVVGYVTIILVITGVAILATIGSYALIKKVV